MERSIRFLTLLRNLTKNLSRQLLTVAGSRVGLGGFKPTEPGWGVGGGVGGGGVGGGVGGGRGGGWGWGGGLREKKHELCQIVLNKQQHLHDAIIAINFDHLFIVAIIVSFETRSSRISRSYLLLIVA